MVVEIFYHQEMMVLRGRNSELVILSQHINQLKTLKESKNFSDYFLQQALMNRAARKLFLSWLKKDQTLWPRLYQMVHQQSDTQKNSSDFTSTKAPTDKNE